jgi:hypothetical protein
VCGAAGAHSAAIRHAAIETIRAGYDRFIVLSNQASNNVGVVGYTPVVANSYGTATISGTPGFATVTGSGTTTYSGGQGCSTL